MPEKKQSQNIQQTAIGDDITQIIGDGNVVNKTIVQRIYQFFAGDAETVEQRNRRIMLGHVENFWVKGILEKSLHGAALLDLGVKESSETLKYPWAIKREVSEEILPAGMPMMQIFQEIGLGRSLLILGAPGSGKTTMLLELTRQLIGRAREDVTEPIPVVFNLSSWTEKLRLADWLARELNAIYYVPRRVAPTWVKENKMLLLLDGLDEVRQDSREKCVDAINQFRKENGLTSMAVCSRSQDYAELKTRLSFDGAIEIQPLTSNQVNDYFNRFDNGLAGIRRVLKKDAALRVMAETPLMLSIMTLTYQDAQPDELIIAGDLKEHRTLLFDTYVTRMFERSIRKANAPFTKPQTLHYLRWLAQLMTKHNIVTLHIEAIQPSWLEAKSQRNLYRIFMGLIFGLPLVVVYGFIAGLTVVQGNGLINGMAVLVFGIFGGLTIGSIGVLIVGDNIKMVDQLNWSWSGALKGLRFGLIVGISIGVFTVLILGGELAIGERSTTSRTDLIDILITATFMALLTTGVVPLFGGLSIKQLDETDYPGKRLRQTFLNTILILSIYGLTVGLLSGLLIGINGGLITGVIAGLVVGLIVGLGAGLLGAGKALIQHFALRLVLPRYQLLPLRLISFLEYAVSLIFLRRVGGGYIFVHRLLMEHFAAMYSEGEK